MKNTLNIIPENPELVFIALNPTKEAIENNAVFSKNESFWNLLIKAEIIKAEIKKKKLNERAKLVFSSMKYSNKKLGFADLLPFISETDSKKVKVENGSAKNLFEAMDNLKSAKRIALLGQKVVDSFAKDFDLKKWEDLDVKNGVRFFGKIGEIKMDNNNSIEVFAMPFPVNNSIANKHEIYSILCK